MPTDPTKNRVYYGRDATVEFADPLESVEEDDTLANQISDSTDFSGKITEITVTDPEASSEVQNTFAGQIKTQTPYDLVTIEFTMRFQDIEGYEQIHGSDDNTVSFTDSDDEEWTRITGSQGPGDRNELAILFKLERTIDGEDYIIHYLLDDATFDQFGEISLAGDGSAEITGTATALIEDRYIEQNF